MSEAHTPAKNCDIRHEAADWIAAQANEYYKPSDYYIREYLRIGELILSRYGDLFPNYEFTGLDAAIDLMAAEITTLQAQFGSLCQTHRDRLTVGQTCSICAWLERNHNSRITQLENELAAWRKLGAGPGIGNI